MEVVVERIAKEACTQNYDLYHHKNHEGVDSSEVVNRVECLKANAVDLLAQEGCFVTLKT